MTNMMKQITVTAILTFSVAVFPVNAAGMLLTGEQEVNRDHSNQEHFKRGKLKRWAKALSLTEMQKSEIKEIKQQARLDSKVLKSNLSGFKAELSELMAADSFDEQKFIALHKEYQEVFSQLALLKAKSRHQVMHILNEEQRNKAKQLNKKHGKRLFH